MHRTRTRIVQLSITVIVVALAACTDEGAEPTSVGAAPMGSPQSSTAATSAPPSRPESRRPVDRVTVLPFVDEFDTDVNGWGGPFQRFADGAYVWDLPSGQSDVRAADTLIDVEDEIDDVVVTTAFTAVGVDAVGIQCAYEELDGSSRWYDLELGTDGTVIRRRPTGSAPIEQLAGNDTITLTDQPTELIAECWRETDGYRLRLLVDGTVAVDASDPEPFGRVGAPNLTARAMPTTADVPEHVVRFDRFDVAGHVSS